MANGTTLASCNHCPNHSCSRIDFLNRRSSHHFQIPLATNLKHCRLLLCDHFAGSMITFPRTTFPLLVSHSSRMIVC